MTIVVYYYTIYSMKAAQLIKYGGQDAVILNQDVSTPKISTGQVLVEVFAAGTNPFDLTVREGRARQMKELSFPATLGGDVAGLVKEIGEEVNGFQIGQEVYGQADALSGQGSFAQYTSVKADQLASKPANADWLETASLPLAGSSAYQALVDHMSLQAGQKILIQGGAGGIGSLAIQLAKYLGAYVATTVSEQDAEYVKNLGADRVIDYKNQDFTQSIKGYDAVFDTVGGETNHKSYGVLKAGGHLVSMLEQPDEELIARYDVIYTAQFTRVTTDHLNKIAELVEKGILKPQIAKVFPLDQAAAALEYMKTNHHRGKIILKVK